MEFKIGAEVIIRFKNGTEAKDSCDIPRGFAGDKDKLHAVIEKFDRETFAVLGEDKALKIKNLFLYTGNQKFKVLIDDIFKIIRTETFIKHH
ncbi:hypothetical protein [Algoriphagus boritolerans]